MIKHALMGSAETESYFGVIFLLVLVLLVLYLLLGHYFEEKKVSPHPLPPPLPIPFQGVHFTSEGDCPLYEAPGALNNGGRTNLARKP